MVRRKRLVIPFAILFLLVLKVSPAHADGIHIVRSGENLGRIAAQYGTTVPAIMQANSLHSPDVVYAGQRLRIPTGGSSLASANPDSYVVQPGDTLFSIAYRFGVSQPALVQANKISDASFVWAGQRLHIPGRSPSAVPVQQPRSASAAAGQRVHIVARGETLFSIAMRYGATVSSITQANGLRAADHIIAGQPLIIPGDGSGPAVAIPSANKWIDVDVTRQRLVAYEGNHAVFSTGVSTGKSSTPTILGRFAIRSKLQSQRMIGPGYDLPNVPWVMYLHGTYAIHGAYWHADFGRAVSHGCVNMRIPDAQWLYNWAPTGTLVVVHG